ncbi:MAG: DUF6331 family protein [Gammaproteobacteria bacterium]|nr:DUF6331 family protein [Gammaproteobacteria bacterium]
MKKRSSKFDIRIGDNEWIEWVKPDQSIEPAKIDEILESANELWDALETKCMHECCGIEAFGLRPKDIKKSVTFLPKEELTNKVENIIKEVEKIDCDSLFSERINQVFEKSVLLKVLNHVHGNIA